jgi:hypothetical protein
MIRKLFLLLCLTTTALAHQTSDSYLALSITNNIIQGRWAISLLDLEHVLQIDTDKNGDLSYAELTNAQPRIENYAYNRLKIRINDEPAKIKPAGFDTEEHSDAIYATLLFEISPPQIGPDFVIEYTLFNDTDPAHRGLFRFDLPERTETAIFSPAQSKQRFFISAPQPSAHFLNFIREGVWHILTGYDHILFLIALLLPSVLHREDNHWQAATSARAALLNIVKVVTAFTIAHSITLTLATLNVVQLPSRLVESIIAASVVAAAVNNLKTFFAERAWMIAFSFGLIHGFGFASALAELHLAASSLVPALLGFNLGVELGQLAIVFAFVPIAFGFRKTNFYQQIVLRYCSLLIAILAAAWFCERALNRRILPF